MGLRARPRVCYRSLCWSRSAFVGYSGPAQSRSKIPAGQQNPDPTWRRRKEGWRRRGKEGWRRRGKEGWRRRGKEGWRRRGTRGQMPSITGGAESSLGGPPAAGVSWSSGAAGCSRTEPNGPVPFSWRHAWILTRVTVTGWCWIDYWLIGDMPVDGCNKTKMFDRIIDQTNQLEFLWFDQV